MPDLRTLKAIYNLPKSGNFRSTLNAIIRRHWPGGSEVLDVMERLHQMQTGRDRPDPALQDILQILDDVTDVIMQRVDNHLYFYGNGQTCLTVLVDWFANGGSVEYLAYQGQIALISDLINASATALSDNAEGNLVADLMHQVSTPSDIPVVDVAGLPAPDMPVLA